MHVGGALSGILWCVVYVALLAPAWAEGEAGYDDTSVAIALAVVILLLTSPIFWMLVVLTGLAIWSWLLLRGNRGIAWWCRAPAFGPIWDS